MKLTSAYKFIKFNPVILIILVITFGAKNANAQLTDFQSAFFQNQYLANPAMAGLDKGLNINLGYQQQWTTITGSPALQNLTADYNAGNRVGLGLNISGNNAGLLSATRIMGTYAYHLPLSDNNNKLNFGLSLGFADTYIDYNKIVADAGDISAQNVNQRGAYVDGDLGISYTGEGFNIQAAVPNLREMFFAGNSSYTTVNQSIFYTALSYKMPLINGQNNFTIEPKVAFRGIKGYNNIFDTGFNLAMNEYNINLSGMYHTDQSVTAAVLFNIGGMGLLFAYTSSTGPLKTYANNTFELGLNLKLWRK